MPSAAVHLVFFRTTGEYQASCRPALMHQYIGSKAIYQDSEDEVGKIMLRMISITHTLETQIPVVSKFPDRKDL